MEALGACTGDSVYRAIQAPWRLYTGFPVQGNNVLKHDFPCTRDSVYRAGAGDNGVEPVGRGYRGLYQYTGIVAEELW